MLSLEQRLVEKFEQLEARGRYGFVKTIQESKDSLEKKLSLCERALNPIKKNLGSSESHGAPVTESRDPLAAKKKLFEAAKKSFGLTDEEAAVFAGLDDGPLKCALANGLTAKEFYESLKS